MAEPEKTKNELHMGEVYPNAQSTSVGTARIYVKESLLDIPIALPGKIKPFSCPSALT
jgi:hypothetical protein